MIFGAKVAKKIHSAFNPPIFLTISILTYIEHGAKTNKKAEKSVNDIPQTEGQKAIIPLLTYL
ncbi:unknown [Prevotella sp. CAG:924]|nr:unknown [Prevotella sp. CAG:924]